MEGNDPEDALALLFTRRSARRAFAEDPEGTLRSLGLGEEVIRALAAMDPEALERQAVLLVDKRRHEVRGLLPRTFEALGTEAAELFGEYAADRWPEGHLRHWLDARGFAEWLRERRPGTADPVESARAEFRCDGGRFRVLRGKSPRGGALWIVLWRRGDEVRAVTIVTGF